MTRWCVLFYLAGADDLEPFMARTMLALEAMGPPPGIEVLVQLARAPASLVRKLLPDRPPTGVDGDWHGVRRYRLRPRPPGGSDSVFHSELIADLGPINTANPSALADLVAYGAENVPADRTLLIVSGHGMGFVGLALDLVSGAGPTIMSLRGMTTCLRMRRLSVDLLLLDACQMNAIEVATQLAVPRPLAEWLIAPAAHAPRAGLDYREMLKSLANSLDSPSVQIAAQIAAKLEEAAGLQVLALQLDPARWRDVAQKARAADRAAFPPMLRAAANTCAYPVAGQRVSLLVHWPDPTHFPARYHHLYRRLRFARLSGWNRYLPSAKPGSLPRERLGPLEAPGPLLLAWLRMLRPDLTPERAAQLLISLGGSVD